MSDNVTEIKQPKEDDPTKDVDFTSASWKAIKAWLLEERAGLLEGLAHPQMGIMETEFFRGHIHRIDAMLAAERQALGEDADKKQVPLI